jgi:hypothetical protein
LLTFPVADLLLPPPPRLATGSSTLPRRASLLTLGWLRRRRRFGNWRVHAGAREELGQSASSALSSLVAVRRVRPARWHSSLTRTLSVASIFFHSFAASVAQSSIVIKSPNSMLARHSWSQLNIAIDVFETASTGGAPVAMFVPRLKSLRENAYMSLENAQSVPMGLARAQVSDYLAEGTDANLSILVSFLSRTPLNDDLVLMLFAVGRARRLDSSANRRRKPATNPVPPRRRRQCSRPCSKAPLHLHQPHSTRLTPAPP